MYANHHFRERLDSRSASLLYFFSGELLKWQFPAVALSQAAAHLSAIARYFFTASPPELSRR